MPASHVAILAADVLAATAAYAGYLWLNFSTRGRAWLGITDNNNENGE